MSLVTILYPIDTEKYVGLCELSIGLGLMIGPLLGAAIYSYFEYFWTMIIFGFFLLIIGIIEQFAIPSFLN